MDADDSFDQVLIYCADYKNIIYFNNLIMLLETPPIP